MNIRQQGFNLIEVLIAMVVLAIGLLGIAGLQLTGARANQGSYYRSQASSIMMDMAERIHNNRPGADAGAYAGFSSALCGGRPRNCARENGTAEQTCDAAQMATYDLYVIACGMPVSGAAPADQITELLPGGAIQVDCITNGATPAPVTGVNCQPGFRHRITVSWQERTQVGAAGKERELEVLRQTITTTMQP